MGLTQLRVHLERLVEMEYVIAHGSRGRGSQYLYELAWFAELEATSTTGSWRGDDGVLAGGAPSTSNGDKASSHRGVAAESAEVGGGDSGARYRRSDHRGVNGASYGKGRAKPLPLATPSLTIHPEA
jgi:hypothetical protein